VTLTAQEPRPVPRRPFRAEALPEQRPATVPRVSNRISPVAWVDAIFYTAMTVFVASLVAYFLID
jgi:hypothetical protein